MKRNSSSTFCIVLSIIVGIDQLIKYLAARFLSDMTLVILIPKILGLNLARNTGAAFSMFQDHQVILMIISLIFLIGVTLYIFLKPESHLVTLIAWGCIAGGALGNLIDRIVLGYVTDYIQLLFIDFPIFNVADISINIGAFILIWIGIRGDR